MAMTDKTPRTMDWRCNPSSADWLFRPCAALFILFLMLVTHTHAQTQAEMNATAREHFARADADLNKTYQAVLKKLPDAESKQKLKEAQRAWIASRNAEATRAADEVRGGSMAPTLRYEIMTELTRERINQLETRLTSNSAPVEKDTSTPSPTPTAMSSASAQESDKEPASEAPNPSSVSPDKKWEYVGGDEPKLVKAGTNELELDFSQGCGLGSVGENPALLWAPNSKRIAFGCVGGKEDITLLYQLRDGHWVGLKTPGDGDELFERAGDIIEAQAKKKGLPKKTFLHMQWWTVEPQRWLDASTLIVHASMAEVLHRNDGEYVGPGFGTDLLLTLKFDASGNWKIVKTHQMSEKEVEKKNAGEDVSGSGQTTEQEGLSADASFGDADRHLNEVYNALRARLSPSELDGLKKEQLAWIDRRNAAAQAAKGNAEGNLTDAADREVTKMTLARAAELEKRLKKAK
jgi:uncharacterized protein YecT (DUF1311 family)